MRPEAQNLQAGVVGRFINHELESTVDCVDVSEAAESSGGLEKGLLVREKEEDWGRAVLEEG